MKPATHVNVIQNTPALLAINVLLIVMATPVAPQFVRLLLHAVTTVPAPPRVNAVAPLASLETAVVSATPIIMDLHVNSALPLPAITMVHATLTMVHAYVPLGTRVFSAINVP